MYNRYRNQEELGLKVCRDARRGVYHIGLSYDTRLTVDEISCTTPTGTNILNGMVEAFSAYERSIRTYTVA